MSIKEFKINDFLTVKLENGETRIYVNGEFFNQCKYLMLDIPSEDIEEYNEIESIDEAAEKLDRSLEGRRSTKFEITPETEFWAHCSNLQVWYENYYDTRLLHSNLAFPLLKKLTKIDPLARKVFKEEIARRIESGYQPVIIYLLKEGYLSYLDKTEFEVIIDYLHKITSQSTIPYYLLGIELFRVKLYDQALLFFNKALKINPKMIEVLIRMAMIYFQKNRLEKASELYDEILQITPKMPDVWIGKAMIYGKEGDFEKTIKCYNEAIEIFKNSRNPLHAHAWLGKGLALERINEFEEALISYNKSLEIDPNYVPAKECKGILNRRLGRNQIALELLKEVIEVEPERIDIAFEVGNILLELNRFKDSLIYYDKVLEKKPFEFIALVSKAWVFTNLKDYEKAFQSFDKALAADPNHAEIWFYKAKLFEQIKMYKDAILCYELTYIFNPLFEQALINRDKLILEINRLGKISEIETGHYLVPVFHSDEINIDNIIDNFKIIVEERFKYLDLTTINPISEAWKIRGQNLQREGNYIEAINCFKKALEISPQHTVLYILEADAYYKLRNYDKANSAYNNAIILDSHNVNAWIGKGIIEAYKKEFKIANFFFSTALNLDPDNYAALYNKGVVLRQLGNIVESNEYLQKAFQIKNKN